MASPNYGYEKRQKELAKKRKKEEKLKRKGENKPASPTEGMAPAEREAGAGEPPPVPGTA